MIGHPPSTTETEQARQAGAECMAAALDYIKRGWSALPVCPPDHACTYAKHLETCTSPGKTPYGRWKERQTSLLTEHEVRTAWRQNPSLNVGIALGPVSGLVRVDIDGPAGEEMLAALCGKIPPTLEFLSGGGRGLLFRIPDGVTIKTTPVKAQGLHAEVRFQAKGAQTVMPPSRHVSGRRYAWLPGHGPDEIEAAPLPAAMAELMAAKASPKPDPVTPASRWIMKAGSGDLNLDRVRRYLDKCDPAISGDGGHNVTFAVVCAVVWGFDLAPDVALDLLQPWNKRCQPEWQDHELRHKIDDALKAEHDKPRGHLRDAPLAHESNGKHTAPPLPSARLVGYWLKASDLYAAYKAWCEASGERYDTANSFTRALGERGIERNSGRRWYLGVALSAEDGGE